MVTVNPTRQPTSVRMGGRHDDRGPSSRAGRRQRRA